MITQEQCVVLIDGINVYDAAIMIQLINKSLESGIITGKEVGSIAITRSRLVAAIYQAIQVDIDNMLTNTPSVPVVSTKPPLPIEVVPNIDKPKEE